MQQNLKQNLQRFTNQDRYIYVSGSRGYDTNIRMNRGVPKIVYYSVTISYNFVLCI